MGGLTVRRLTIKIMIYKFILEIRVSPGPGFLGLSLTDLATICLSHRPRKTPRTTASVQPS